ncbi:MULTISPECIES: ABC transporter ATP-binding protein [Alicyclobacillus]|uniref:Putative ABC transport system ATP-binding protein n=1 Tax=Alicyclobacillus vulcanalis TaxID=252246 RepID=A0A1N7PFN2_9BACL|nr:MULTISPECIES: ABC transporter ATP-binding protein [Alicyclobacillus]SIT09455.1 putative ABC transport system ATP-binding protein [Alicyclobacillus vulcanalis]
MRNVSADEALIQMEHIVKEYLLGGQVIRALNDVSLLVRHGEFVAIMGPSGSGKSTMMNMIGCLDVPTSGRYVLDGVEVSTLTEDEMAYVRNQKIGFIFQNFNLLPRMTALENVELPMLYMGIPARERRERALEALERVGLKDRIHNRPNELSGGQQQRVAIARAIVNRPSMILGDEPTGALDSKTTEDILALLHELHEQGNTIILVTHDAEVGAHAERVIHFRDGRVESDSLFAYEGES